MGGEKDWNADCHDSNYCERRYLASALMSHTNATHINRKIPNQCVHTQHSLNLVREGRND